MAGLTCFVLIAIPIGIIGTCFGLYFWNLARINRQIRDAFNIYRSSLELLKQSPNDPECREKTLHLGRYYSNLTRSNRGVTVYDEVALANDIAAACAGAGQIPSSAIAVPTIAGQSIEQRLGRLKALLESGAIDESEYRERRGKLLDEV
ncbi:MAG: SHOCT domain-containing protein [Thermoanaerobaculia bacterium]